MQALSGLLTVASVSLLAAISPGPDFAIVVKNSLSYSRSRGMITAFGVCFALLIHISYTLIGLGSLTSTSSPLYLIIKYLGASYLFYIGYKSFRSSFKQTSINDMQIKAQPSYISSTAAFKQGFLTNLLNPKCALFFVSLFSQLVIGSTSFSLKMGYAFVNWIVSLSWFLFLSYLITGKLILSKMEKYRIYVDRTMGVLLIILSLKMFFSH